MKSIIYILTLSIGEKTFKYLGLVQQDEGFGSQLTHLAKQIKSPMMHDAGLTVQTVKTSIRGVTNFHTTEISYTSKQHYNSRLCEAVSLQLKKDHFKQNQKLISSKL